jgi:hypothetical protein
VGEGGFGSEVKFWWEVGMLYTQEGYKFNYRIQSISFEFQLISLFIFEALLSTFFKCIKTNNSDFLKLETHFTPRQNYRISPIQFSLEKIPNSVQTSKYLT